MNTHKVEINFKVIRSFVIQEEGEENGPGPAGYILASFRTHTPQIQPAVCE